MKKIIGIFVLILFTIIMVHQIKIYSGITASKPIKKTTKLIPGKFAVNGIFSNGSITPEGLQLDLESQDPISLVTYKEIVSNPRGSILGVVVTRLNNKIVYNVYDGSNIRNWMLQGNNKDPLNNQPIIKIKYYISSSPFDLYEFIPLTSTEINDDSFFNGADGTPDFQTAVGRYFLSKKKYELAKKWLQKANEQGSPYAEITLAHIYKEGLGVSQDYDYAAFLYKQAAKTIPEAIKFLGQMYELGQGVPQNYYRAYELYHHYEGKTGNHLNQEIERLFVKGDEEIRQIIKRDEGKRRVLTEMELINNQRDLIPYANNMVAVLFQENDYRNQDYYKIPEEENSNIIYGYLSEKKFKFILQPLIKISFSGLIWEPVLNNHLPVSIKILTSDESEQIDAVIESGIAKFKWPNVQQY